MRSARLPSWLPERLRRCLPTLPEDTRSGATPQRLAKEASLCILSGLFARRNEQARPIVHAHTEEHDQGRARLGHQPPELVVDLPNLF
jgi:hypothetical protein